MGLSPGQARGKLFSKDVGMTRGIVLYNTTKKKRRSKEKDIPSQDVLSGEKIHHPEWKKRITLLLLPVEKGAEEESRVRVEG